MAVSPERGAWRIDRPTAPMVDDLGWVVFIDVLLLWNITITSKIKHLEYGWMLLVMGCDGDFP